MRAYHLDNRGLIKITGADRKGFLQGLITNDIDDLHNGGILYAAVLTPQGKYLWDFFLYEVGEDIFLDCEADQITSLLQRLTMYKLRADVTLEDVSKDYKVYSIFDERAQEAITCCYDPRVSDQSMGGRALFEADIVPKSDPYTWEDYENLRLSKGIPDGRRDILAEKTFCLEANLDHFNGVSFTKGCYVGQEMTSRMMHRTTRKKSLLAVTVEGGAAEHGTEIVTEDGKSAGDIRSSLGEKAIAFLRLEHKDKALSAAGKKVTVMEGHNET